MSETNSTPLTPQALQLCDALRSALRWVNRTELAALMKKSALNKWDLVLLTKLEQQDLIETQKVSRHGPIGYEWQYRTKRVNETSE